MFLSGANYILMGMTNLTRIASLGSIALIFLLLPLNKNFGQSLTCTDMVQVSVSPTISSCSATLSVSSLASGGIAPLNFFSAIRGVKLIPAVVSATEPYVTAYGNNTLTINNSTSILGKVLTVTITDASGNKCWSKVVLEDKSAPVITCTIPPFLMSCLDTISSAFPNPLHSGVPRAVGSDNCGIPEVILVSEVQSTQAGPICEKDSTIITRTYQAVDAFGNRSSTCQTVIKIGRPNIQLIDDLAAPDDTLKLSDLIPDKVFSCSLKDLEKHESADSTGKELLKFNKMLCGYQIKWTDSKLSNRAPCDYTYKILRDWIAICWCTGKVLNHQQVVKVIDNSPPPLDKIPSSVNLSANQKGTHPAFCSSTGKLPIFESIDTCSGPAEIKISTPLGLIENGGSLPQPGLTLGDHIVTVILTDKCGNQSFKNVTLVVKDDIAPVAVCQEFTIASLTNEGKVTVFANSFDAGSHDNCCLDKIKVKKIGQADSEFNDFVKYDCNDLPGPHKVILRAYDCNSPQLYNDCLVDLKLQDKLKPTISCPDKTITCDEYALNLREQLQGKTGEDAANLVLGIGGITPIISDNCTPTRVFGNYTNEIDKCYSGIIRLVWKAKDQSGNESDTCHTIVTSTYKRDILWHATNKKDSSDIVFPGNKTLDCLTDAANIDFGKVWINPARETCELIATTYCDVIFTAQVGDLAAVGACYKVVRTYQVVDWCTFGGEKDGVPIYIQQYLTNRASPIDLQVGFRSKDFAGSKNGNACTAESSHLAWQQTVYVFDNVAPVFTHGCSIDSVKIENDACTATVTLPKPTISDCSSVHLRTANSPLGEGFGPFTNVKPGTYAVTYIATDLCNNFTTCKTSVKVFDGKPPVAYCKNSLIIVLNDQGKATVSAKDFDFKSFDNCSSNLKFSFSSDTTFTTLNLECRHVGAINIEMWVTDEAGNKDFCQTLLFVQQHVASPCPRPRLAVAGKVSNENDGTIEGVTLKLSGSNEQSFLTSADGQFHFEELELGADYSVTPKKNSDYLNGVSTFDMVLISRHILGIQHLNSPYKIIAADVNKSGYVTTLDLVEIRKLILFVNSSFPSNDSWRFVEKDFVFTNPQNPFSSMFPEAINVNNIESEILDANFVAVKIGDVNGSAAVNLLHKPESRNTSGSFEISIEDRILTKGDFIEVPFHASISSIIGFQFALNFNPAALELVEVIPGVLKPESFGNKKIDNGELLTSWYRNTAESTLASELFTLKFKVKSNGPLKEFLSLNKKDFANEAYNSTLEFQAVQLNFISKDTHILSVSNSPNPFRNATSLRFTLPVESHVKITISDATGRIYRTVEKGFSRGLNEIYVRREDLGGSGIYTYFFQAGSQTQVGKLVLID